MTLVIHALVVSLVGLSAQLAAADVKVAATVAPIHSLVSMVTEADVVFWVGEALEPWMIKPIETLAADAVVVDLARVEDVRLLEVRDDVPWVDGKRKKTDLDSDITKSAPAPSDNGKRRSVRAFDPHVWLDPENAKVWLRTIPEILAGADPENAETYRTNGRLAVERIEALTRALGEQLASVRSIPYVVFHDAYQYFETRFGLNLVGAISRGDADRPGAARIATIRDRVRDSKAVCVFAEPQFEPKLVDAVTAGSGARKGVLDPIGANLQPGPELYPTLMRQMAAALVDCLGSQES